MAKSLRTLIPKTVAIMREVLDDAWEKLTPELQSVMSRAVMADRIIKSAAKGERDRKRLLDAALRFAA